MKRCKVLIPFHMKATDTIYVPGDEIEVSEEQLANIQSIHKDMVEVMAEVKKKKTKKQ